MYEGKPIVPKDALLAGIAVYICNSRHDHREIAIYCDDHNSCSGCMFDLDLIEYLGTHPDVIKGKT